MGRGGSGGRGGRDDDVDVDEIDAALALALAGAPPPRERIRCGRRQGEDRWMSRAFEELRARTAIERQSWFLLVLEKARKKKENEKKKNSLTFFAIESNSFANESKARKKTALDFSTSGVEFRPADLLGRGAYNDIA